jgi:aspartate/glutamate racemase
MKAFKINKILVPVDLSANSMLALEHATFMAKLFKADLILAHVMETKVAKLDLGTFTASDKKYAEQIINEKLGALATELKIKVGGKVTYLIKAGKIAESRTLIMKVIDSLIDRGARAIVLGCTELPLAIDATQKENIPIVNSIDSLVKAALTY